MGPGVMVVLVATAFAGAILATGRAAVRSARRAAVGNGNRTSGATGESEDRENSCDPRLHQRRPPVLRCRASDDVPLDLIESEWICLGSVRAQSRCNPLQIVWEPSVSWFVHEGLYA